ncbi:MAG: DUF4347 domain-containing protein [Pseudomonadales bacterium]|nr:DUF4347 domain-containing protein [Pseudomonadales bacterium]MBO7005210.1 DUF4347 domain-containing protein [Pseudomonadales bacterium]
MGKKDSQFEAKGAGWKQTGAELLSLEPRFMFDAAGIATGAEVAADSVAEAQAEAALDSGENHPSTAESTDVNQLMAALAGAPATDASKAIVFIDTTVSGYEALLEGIDPGAEVVLLEAGQDGLAQMLNVLEDRSDIDAIHIISHGEAGELHLGTTTLDLDSMQGEFTDELARISEALSESADILIYGCNFAQGETGVQAAQLLGALTGADIAASTDLTGHADAGADWELEYESGPLEAAGMVSQAAQEAFVGILMDTDGDGVDDSDDVDDDNDGILDLDEGLGQTVSVSSGELQVQNLSGGGTNTLTTTISLPGAVVGESVTLSNFLVNGDLNITAESFSVSINGAIPNGFGFLYTPGAQFAGFQSPSEASGPAFPNTFLATVVDIDLVTPGDQPGVNIEIVANSEVDDWSAANYVLSLTFDLDYVDNTGQDSDGDGKFDHVDLDSDNDGITDNVEAQLTESYLVPSGTVSTVGPTNGLDTSYTATTGLTPVDSDNDGIADFLDDDSDGDGIPDIEERGDSQPVTLSSSTDTDGDGLVDIFESSNIADLFDANDENLTGVVFNLADSDNDILPDGSNAFGLSQNLDFRENTGRDTDQDGVEDDVDLDSDNDGILNTDEGFTSANGSVQSADLTITALEPDPYPLGDPDFIEVFPVGGGSGTTTVTVDLSGVSVAGQFLEVGDTVTVNDFTADGDLNTNPAEAFTLNFNDGEVVSGDLFTGEQFQGQDPLTGDPSFVVTLIDIDPGPGVAPGFKLEIVVNDQVDNTFGGSPDYGLRLDFDVDFTVFFGSDTDSDGVFDYLDIDSDNDGITDNVEAQLTNNYVFPSGTYTNGLDDAYTGGLSVTNTDGDATPDFLDSDSDGDGTPDIEERGDGAPTSLTSTTDTDGDGLLDIFEGSSINDVDVNDENISGTGTMTLVFNLSDSDGDTDADGLNADPSLNIDLDFREDSNDPDNDGVSNASDLDDDGDGILDTNEGFGPTTISSGEINSILGSDVNPTTITKVIDLSEYGLAIGNTVTIDNALSNGGMAGGVGADEFFTVTFNPGYGAAEDQYTNLTTNADYAGLQALAGNPLNGITVEIVDIDGNGTPGIIVELDPEDGIDTSNAETYQVQLVFDIDFTANRDVDGDGLPDYLDIDSDNDGITDNVEAQPTDGYILPGGSGSVDAQGRDSAYGAGGLSPVDTDGDGRADVIDSDSDQDGRPDVAERGSNGPVVVSDNTDTDNDGLLDIFEGSSVNDADPNDENLTVPGTGTFAFTFTLADTDNDTLPDGSDADPSAAEPNDLDYRDGRTDFDGDGIIDSLDVDADGDGILNLDERSDQGGVLTVDGNFSTDPTNEGIEVDDVGPVNQSNGGVYFDVPLTGFVEEGDTVYITNVVAQGDLDSDFSVEWFRIDINDGEYSSPNLTVNSEFEEDGSGNPVFLDVINPVNAPVTVIDLGGGEVGIRYLITTPEGVNNIGRDYAASVKFDVVWDAPDSDNDGQPDWLDIDKDNDGITDNVEAQATGSYIAPTGTVSTDTATIGLDIAYLTVGAGGVPGLEEVDSDGDTTVDTYDADSDDDTIDDIAERGDNQPRSLVSTADADADGLLDIFEGATLLDADPNDENVSGTSTANFVFNLSDSDDDVPDNGVGATPTTTDLDYRDAADTDGDGVPNVSDVDDDNDGILDTDEGLTANPGSLTSQGIAIDDTTTTVVTTIALPDLLVGDTVTISDILADGDLDAAGETFDLTFNPATDNVTFSNLQTGTGFTGLTTLTSPIVPTQLTVVDIDAGTPGDQPGIFVTITRDASVADEINFGYAARFTVDVSWEAPDTDGDGVADYLDLDSDNDGLSDLFESGNAAGIAADLNRDGTISLGEGGQTEGGTTADVNLGLLEVFESNPTSNQDSDGDLVDDVLDLDSDNDGIADTIEFRATAGYVSNDGDVRDNDADGDGVIDIFDSNDLTSGDFGGTFDYSGNDADGDGTPDYLDQDSDNDDPGDDSGIDSAESGLTLSGTDANADGIDDDNSIGVSYSDPDGVLTDPSSGLNNQVGDTSEVGFRESNLIAADDLVQIGEVNESTSAVLSNNPIGNDNYSLPGIISIASVSSATTGGPVAITGSEVTITTDLGAQVRVTTTGEIEYFPNGIAALTDLNFGDAPVVDSFTYTIETDDGSGITAAATVRITVEPNNEYELDDITNGDGSDGTTFNGAAATDQAGFTVTSLGDINGDGYDDLAIAAVTESTNGTYAGATYVVFGTPNGIGATFELSSLDDGDGTDGFVLRGIDEGDLSGRAVSGGDVNGDGLADIIIGAVNADPNGDKSGEVYVIFGQSDFSSILSTAPGDSGVFELSELAGGDGTAGFVINGVALNDKTGRWLDYAGDVNGDGLGDILIGAPGANAYAGETYLVYGKTDFTPLFGTTPGVDSGVFELSQLTDVAATGADGTVFNGASAGDNSGNFVAGNGDFNGDGLRDIVIGAYYAGYSGYNTATGATYVIYGDTSGFGAEVNLADLDGTDGFELVGAAGDYSGKSLDLFDFNGDGFDDLVTTAPYADANGYVDNGITYVIFGEAGTPFTGSQSLSSAADVTINGVDSSYAGSGFKVISAGDVNSDGFDDLLIGRVPVAGVDQGAAYIIFGNDSYTSGSSIEVSDVVPDAASTVGGDAGLTVDIGFVLSGIDSDDYAGQAIAAAGDFNGDGFDDLIIGAYTAEPNGIYSGEAYLIYGKDYLGDTDEHLTGTTGADSLSGTLAQELLVGGDGNDLLNGGLGDDALFGGNGDDTLVYEENDSNTVDGGGGTDTLSFIGRSGLTLDLTSTSNNLFTDIEVIDLTGLGSNHLILSTLDLLAISGSTNILTVNGDGDDSVTLSDSGWVEQVGALPGYNVYTNGEAEIRIQTGVSITVSDLADEYKMEEAPLEHEIQFEDAMMVDAGESLVEIERLAGLPTFSQQLTSAHGQFAQRADTLMSALTA